MQKYTIGTREFLPDTANLEFNLQDLAGISPEDDCWVLVPPFTMIPEGTLCIVWHFMGGQYRKAKGSPRIAKLGSSHMTEYYAKPADPASLYFVRKPDFKKCQHFPLPTHTLTEVARLYMEDDTEALLWHTSKAWQISYYQRTDYPIVAFTMEDLEEIVLEHVVQWEDLDTHKVHHNPKFHWEA